MDTPTAIDMDFARIVQEWTITIQTPVIGSEALLTAIRDQIDLVQGHYACCLHVSAAGEQQFRALDGSHAGPEETIQSVPVVDITLSIPASNEVLQNALKVIFDHHVHEDPTIRISEGWATRSTYSSDPHNPNKYWNRDDADAIHGKAL